MGAGCSSAAPDPAAVAQGAEVDTVAGPQPGYVYLSYHRADTGDQRGEGGDGAAGRIRDWLTSKGYVVLMGERDDDADGGKKGVMGELLDRLQAAGVMPAPNAVDGAAAAAAAGRTSAYTSDVEWCFQPGPEDPKEEDYAVVKCYTRQLQEIVDRLSLTVRPTVLDLGGETFSGDLPQLMLADAAAAAALSAAGSPATGGTLLLSRPHVTLRNGCIKLRQDQEFRILSPGIVLDQISVVTELRQAGARASRKKLSTTGAAGGGGGAGGGIDNGDGAGGVVGYGAVYEMGRAMVVMAAGAVGLRAFNCQFTNHGPHLALWLASGATAAFHECQLAACTLANSSMHVGLAVGGGCRVRADKCMVSGNQTGVSIYAGATVELVGCESTSNTLAGVEVREPGTTLTAIDCKLSQNSQSGLLVAQGGSARMTSCGAGGNRTHGVLVRGEGSFAALRQVTLSYNQQAGLLVNGAAKVDLVNCEAIGNKMCALIVWGAGTQAVAQDCRFNTNVQAGMAVKDGGRCELTRCAVRGNKLPSEVAGAGSWLGTRQCVMDEKPVVARGGAVQELLPEGKGGKGGKK
eukprot:XP_001701506.1 predicted protein [Chlamydomonas reinhardtii]